MSPWKANGRIIDYSSIIFLLKVLHVCHTATGILLIGINMRTTAIIYFGTYIFLQVSPLMTFGTYLRML